jgi:hypothetical protein
MTVTELIKKLSACDPDAIVVVDGYEGGVDDLEMVMPVAVSLNYNGSPQSTDVWGIHELVQWDYSDFGAAEVVPGVYLPRRGRP